MGLSSEQGFTTFTADLVMRFTFNRPRGANDFCSVFLCIKHCGGY